MTGWTLPRYFARSFGRAVAVVFGGLFVLTYLLDFVDLLRRAGEVKAATAGRLAFLSLLRVPAITEQVLPFAVLFGAMAAFITLTRRLELVVTRAAGLSVWQFLLPSVAVAIGIGAVASLAYNPLSATAKLQADHIEAALFGATLAQPVDGLWFRQRSVDGQAILRGDRLADDHLTLDGVTAFVFEPDGSFMERVWATSATLRPGYWQFENARVTSADPAIEPRTDATYLLASGLQPHQLTEATLSPHDVSFWALPSMERRTEAAGLDATPFRLQFQTLLAAPLLLVTMVLIAAVFSLRFFRFGGIARMAAGGIAAGFVLYVATKLTADMGTAGILNTGVAAWSPAILGTMLATLVLLHQEDG